MSDNTLALPFNPGARLIELGGGNQPILHPNLDVRLGPNVAIVADFNRPLPIPSNSYDGLLCKFVIEHLSWKKVRQFIHETHRILTPGGIGFFITANLLEQARKLVEAPEWNDDLICMLFGGQNIESDDWYRTWMPEAHHCGFSPKYAETLFKAAGYYEVKVYPLPGCDTDMVILAKKSAVAVTYGLG